MEYRNLYVFDLDGTLCDIPHRLKCIKECVNDEPLSGTIEILKSLQRCGKQICICSGRSDKVQAETIQWLQLQGIDVIRLILVMRKDGDYRSDVVVKNELLTRVLEILNSEYKGITWNPIIFEDRKQVVDMWRNKGFTCYQVAPGEF